MSENTKAIWEYAKRHNIPYDTVEMAMSMVRSNPELDIFATMLSPTDSQYFAMQNKQVLSLR